MSDNSVRNVTQNSQNYGHSSHHDDNDSIHYPLDPHLSYYTQPIKIPGANQTTDSLDEPHVTSNYPTLLSASASPRKLGTGYWFSNGRCYPNCRQSSQWATEGLLSCSPMVTGPRRNIHLPDLNFRDAILEEWAEYRRAMAAAADGEGGAMKRIRSRSLGDVGDGGRSSSSSLLLGENQVLRSSATRGGLGSSHLPIVSGRASDRADELYRNEEGKNNNHFRDNTTLEFGDVGYGPYGTIQSNRNDSTIIPSPRTESAIEKEGAFSHENETQSTPAILRSDERLTPISSPTSRTVQRTDSETILHELAAEFDTQSNSPFLSILYGLVNSSIILPILMSFGSIIYHDDFFRPYLSILMKLTVLSGAVHQITFSTVSSLPFAVGQVQDAGLIFLSAMARDLVSRCRAAGYPDEAYILATTTIGLSLFTAILGGALILVGKWKLASYCQLLPSSVVGGYLAFIGFFCGQAGLALMASVDVSGLMEWYKFLDGRALVLMAPGMFGGVFIYFSVRRIRHMAVLPACIGLLLIVFYCALWVTGMSVEEAIENGWINEPVESVAWNHTWDYLRLNKVVWRVLPSQTLTLAAMISVVALSSSLDIAAIEMELKRPLNYNHELKTVGISNIVSGLTGGYTGSYIFSQTIFSLRTGIRSRLMGYVIAFLSVVVVFIPFNILSYIPNFFFGSLLIMICLDLMFEWLVEVKSKVTPAEYIVVLSTFALLQVLGVEFGIMAGVVLYLIIQKMGYNVGSNNNEDGKV
ncbi:hypothetical protein ACHAXS_014188 [Conticribra weissflogii]